MCPFKRIRTLEQLHAAALNRRAVICPSRRHRPEPAAFVISQQARVVLHLIQAGLWIYDKPKRKTAKRN